MPGTNDQHRNCSRLDKHLFRRGISHSSVLPEERLRQKKLSTTTRYCCSQDIEFSDRVQQVDIEFRSIPDNLPSIKMGYTKIAEGPLVSYVLEYGSTRVTMCGTFSHNLICAPRKRNAGEHGNSGGSLVSCINGLKDCRLIGVLSGARNSKDVFVSTHVEQDFIKTYLHHPVFVRIDATRCSAMSKLFISQLSFFIIMLISYWVSMPVFIPISSKNFNGIRLSDGHI